MESPRVRTITMLRHQTIAVALFLSAGCELAGAPPPAKPAPASASASASASETESESVPVPVPGLSGRVGSTEPAAQEMEMRPMSRMGPTWGKEKPRFKIAAPAPAPAPAPASSK
jgi:hypothetical protein